MLLLIPEEWVCPSRAFTICMEYRGSAPAPVCFQNFGFGEPGLATPDASSGDVGILVDEHLWTGGTSSQCSLCSVQKKARQYFSFCLYQRPHQKGSFQAKWNVVMCWRMCRILDTHSACSVKRGAEEEVLWALRCSSPQTWLPCSFYSPDLCWEITAQHRSPELFCRSTLEACFFPSVCSWVYFPSGVEIIILLVSYVLALTEEECTQVFYVVVVFFCIFFSFLVQFLLLKYSGQQLLPT